MGFRAEDVRVSDDQGGFEVEVTAIDRLGESTIVHTRSCGENEGSKLSEESAAESILARLDPDTNLASGERVRLFVHPDRVLWFDDDSGENLLKEQK